MKDENKENRLNTGLRLGNYGVARGAFEAGCTVAAAYPGTPSTEITEFIAKYPEINAEWSPNEKVALEVGIGASLGGARALVSMKHVGLNVAADPLFTASYTGVNGGLVIAVADDPGMFSSQNEQDSRFYARSAHVLMLEPSDTQEAKDFTKLAFELSEKYDTPVLLRMCTRISHGQSMLTEEPRRERELKPYVKDIAKYVMVPGFAKKRHVIVEKRMDIIAADTNVMDINRAEMRGADLGVVCAGTVYQYVREALPDASVFKIGTVYPLPVEAVRAFSKKVGRLAVIEELEPFIETELKAAGIACEGKKYFSRQSELSVNIIKEKLAEHKGACQEQMGTEGIVRGNTPSGTNPSVPICSAMLGQISPSPCVKTDLPHDTTLPSPCVFPAVPPEGLPLRPPVLCAGCPHRGVFSVIGKLKLTALGDIGCYSLGALPPLFSMDTLVCMGASIGMAAGFEKARGIGNAKNVIAVIGDSTFVHSGITGLIDAVYNGLNTKVVIMDNSTTGMTGHQHHPATGRTITGAETYKLSLEGIAAACGVKNVVVADAYDLAGVERVLKEQLALPGVSVIIARAPCVLIVKERKGNYSVNEKCTGCKQCIKTSCPALGKTETGSALIDWSKCAGCGVCAQFCKFNAIAKG